MATSCIFNIFRKKLSSAVYSTVSKRSTELEVKDQLYRPIMSILTNMMLYLVLNCTTFKTFILQINALRSGKQLAPPLGHCETFLEVDLNILTNGSN